MLKFLRSSTNGIVIKVLMILLVLTFVLWGVGDVLRQSNKVVAFKVGDHEFTDIEWEKAYKKQLNEIEGQLGKKFTPEEQEALGVRRAILNQLISKTLILEEARNLGLLISDDMVKYELSAMPTFVRDGKFDKEIFERVLRNSGLSEAQFVAMLKEDMAAQNIETVQTINKEMPSSYIDTLLKAKGEIRSIKLFKISNTNAIPTPKEEDLKSIYESNIDRFSNPEQRDVNYITFGIENTSSSSATTDDELKEHYENNKVLYTEPEKRKVLQLIFKDESQAKDAEKQLAGGKSFDDVAKAMFPDKTNFLLGEDVMEKSFDKEISEAIFKTAQGATSPIAKSPMGWHIFKIEAIKPSKTKSFEEVKAQLKSQFEEELRFDALTKLAQDIDQEISMGTKLAEIASKYSLKVNAVSSWKSGEKTADAMTANQRFASSAFSTDNGNLSSVTPYQGNDKFFVLEVAKINAKTPKAFNDVKVEIAKIWEEKTRTQALEQKAKDVLAALKASQNVDEVANKQGITVQNGIQISLLDASKSTLPQELKEEIFKLDVGKFTIPVADSKDSYVIAQLEKTIPLDNAKLQENRKLVELELVGSIGNEMMSQYLNYLHNKYKVVVYEDVIKL
jgi:peptidyl-prolyl cis-trans isomerase D